MHHLPVLLWRGVVSGGKVSACQDWVSPSEGEGTRRLLRASHLRYVSIPLGVSSGLLLFKIFLATKFYVHLPTAFPSRNISVGTETIMFAGMDKGFSLLFSIQWHNFSPFASFITKKLFFVT